MKERSEFKAIKYIRRWGMVNKLILWFLVFIIFSYSAWGEERKKEERLEDMIVTATRAETPVENAPASVSLITKEQIELKGAKTLEETLKDVPGVLEGIKKGLMRHRFTFTLRGIPEQKRTLILLDGIVLNDLSLGTVSLAGYNPEDLERVEVVRGPFSSLYGGYAMGGVIHFLTKMPEKQEFSLKVGYGSSWERGEALDDLKRVYVSYGNKLRDKFSFFFSYGRHDTNGYPSVLIVPTTPPPPGITGYKITKTRVGNPAYLIGDRGDEKWWDDGMTLKLRYEFSKDTKLNLSFMRTRHKSDDDDPHTYLWNQTTGKPVWSYGMVREWIFLSGYSEDEQNIYAIGFEKNLFEDLKLKLNLSFLEEKGWGVAPSLNATRFGCLGPINCGIRSNSRQETYMGDLQLSFPLFNRHLFIIGGSFRQGEADTKQKNLSNWKDKTSTISLRAKYKGKDRTYALFLQDEIMLHEKLTLFIGFRQDFWKAYDGYENQVGNPGYPKSYPSKSASSFNPKFALLYKPLEGTALRASIGRAFRPPTLTELYVERRHGGNIYRGNPNLDPETVISWDIGVEQKIWKGAKFSLTFFENHLKDLVYNKLVKDQPIRIYDRVNVGKAKSRGVELDIEQKLKNGLRLFANLTYTDSEVTKNKANPSIEGKRLTLIPLWRYNLGLEFAKGKTSAYLVGRYVDKWYGNDDNSDKTNYVYGSYDPHFVVDGRIAYNITNSAKLSFAVDNIFNNRYYQFFKTPGRQWFAELAIKF
ncbi:MAG: TonB-dependent receptor [Thermodesulfobacteriaceae bacterium]|nr:TonB-dependent receptor [Thermodesulfobacteriaceae bacterium]